MNSISFDLRSFCPICAAAGDYMPARYDAQRGIYLPDHDDTDAIEAMFDACKAMVLGTRDGVIKEGGSCYVSPGSHLVSRTLTIPRHVELFGAREMSRLEWTEDFVGSGLIVGHGAVVRDLAAVNVNPNNAAGGGIDFALTAQGYAGRISSVGWASHVIVDGGELITIEQLNCGGATSYGVPNAQATGVWITARAGTVPNSSNGVTISECQFNGPRICVHHGDGTRHTVRNCNSEGAGMLALISAGSHFEHSGWEQEGAQETLFQVDVPGGGAVEFLSIRDSFLGNGVQLLSVAPASALSSLYVEGVSVTGCGPNATSVIAGGNRIQGIVKVATTPVPAPGGATYLPWFDHLPNAIGSINESNGCGINGAEPEADFGVLASGRFADALALRDGTGTHHSWDRKGARTTHALSYWQGGLNGDETLSARAEVGKTSNPPQYIAPLLRIPLASQCAFVGTFDVVARCFSSLGAACWKIGVLVNRLNTQRELKVALLPCAPSSRTQIPPPVIQIVDDQDGSVWLEVVPTTDPDYTLDWQITAARTSRASY